MFDYIKVFDWINSQWYRGRGLFVSIILANIVYHFGAANIKPLLEITFDGLKSNPRLLPTGHLIGFFLLSAIIIVFWLLGRRMPIFKNNEIAVLFSPRGSEEVQKVIRDLRERLKEELVNVSLGGSIRLVTLPPNYCIETVEQANEIRSKSNCCLIIWGYMSVASQKKKKLYTFPKIHFTYKIPIMELMPKIQTCAAVGMGIGGRRWSINEENESLDLDVMSKNLRETTLYILGLILFLYGHYENASAVFEDLKQNIETKKIQNFKWRYLFKEKILFFLREAYLNSAKVVYRTNIFRPKGFNIDRKSIEFCLDRTNRALNEKLNWAQAHLCAATFYFFLDNVSKSREHIELAKEYSKTVASAWLSSAFLDLCEEKYEHAVSEYEEAFGREAAGGIYMEVIAFISHYFDIHPGKVQFRFAIGLLNKIIGNFNASAQEFHIFLKESIAFAQMRILSEMAKKYIAEMETEQSQVEAIPENE
ncbi:MAG: hypothetical protein ABH891_07080 [Candidatus Omnitrophota bacterium]